MEVENAGAFGFGGFHLRLLASSAVVALLMAAPALAAPPPASAFGRIPGVVDAEISPNGQRIAILGGTSEARVLSIATIDQQGLPTVPLGAIEAVDLRWAGNDQVLVRLAVWKQMAPRVSYRFERNISVNANGSIVGELLPGDVASTFLVAQPILGVTPTQPARVLVEGLAESGGPEGRQDTRMKRKGEKEAFVPLLFSVDPATGKGKIVERGTFDTWSWDVDLTGEPRVREEVDDITHVYSLFGKPKGKGQYALLWKGADFDSRRLYYGYSDPDDAVYLGIDGGLVRKRLSDGATEPLGKPTATTPSLVMDQHRGTAVGVSAGAEKPTVEWLDPELGAVHGALSRAFKTASVELSSWSSDRTRFIVKVKGPTTPTTWYLFDKPRKELSPMGEEYPELKGATLGTTSWMTYKARDGAEVPAYLTLPPGAAAGKLPLVVLPHGGPAWRDFYEFDYLAQFIASRGYAVLQPQFRGSWGFGDAFEKAGDGEWGGKVQTDLLDGVAALGAQGKIDPARVCIVGASFGGYSALAGATLHPEAYRCAASIAGISDLGLLLVEKGRQSRRDGASAEELREMVGKASPAKLAETSPSKHADAVRAPILLIHGDQDTVVMPEQSEAMANALKAAGKPVEYVVLEGENHYLTKPAMRTKTLEAIEAFLAKNLPVTN